MDWKPFVATFGLVFLAELGDKSQLLLVGFATRYRPVPVLVGAAIAIIVAPASRLGAAYGFFGTRFNGFRRFGGKVPTAGKRRLQSPARFRQASPWMAGRG